MNIIAITSETIHNFVFKNFVVFYSNEDSCIKLSDLVNNTTKSFDFNHKDDVQREIKSLGINPFNHNKIEGFYQFKDRKN